MENLTSFLPLVAAYHPTLLVVTALSLMVLVQSGLTAPLAFVSEEQVPGMPLRHDHSRLSFRALRTYENSTENFPAFGWAVLVCILTGAAPVMVNSLAVLYLGFRLAFWAVYYAGFGKIAGGPRTLCYVGGLVTNFALGVAAAIALLT